MPNQDLESWLGIGDGGGAAHRVKCARPGVREKFSLNFIWILLYINEGNVSAQIDLLRLVRRYLTCGLNLHLLVKVMLVVVKVAKST